MTFKEALTAVMHTLDTDRVTWKVVETLYSLDDIQRSTMGYTGELRSLCDDMYTPIAVEVKELPQRSTLMEGDGIYLDIHCHCCYAELDHKVYRYNTPVGAIYARYNFKKFPSRYLIVSDAHKSLVDSFYQHVSFDLGTEEYKLGARLLYMLDKYLSKSDSTKPVYDHDWKDAFKEHRGSSFGEPLNKKLFNDIKSAFERGDNILLSGYAGTGKGVLVDQLISDFSKTHKVRVCRVGCHMGTTYLDLSYGVNAVGQRKIGVLLEGMALAGVFEDDTHYVVVLDEFLSCDTRLAIGPCMDLLSHKYNVEFIGDNYYANIPKFHIIATGNQSAYTAANLDGAVLSRFTAFEVRGSVVELAKSMNCDSALIAFLEGLLAKAPGLHADLRQLTSILDKGSDIALEKFQSNIGKYFHGDVASEKARNKYVNELVRAKDGKDKG